MIKARLIDSIGEHDYWHISRAHGADLLRLRVHKITGRDPWKIEAFTERGWVAVVDIPSDDATDAEHAARIAWAILRPAR